MPTVLITDYNFQDTAIEREIFTDAGIDVVEGDVQSPEGIVEAATTHDVDALLIQFADVTDAVFEALPDLRAVGRYGIGYDTIDVRSATKHGVPVLNVPAYCIDEVAEHALALVLACERNVSAFDTQVQGGTWDWKEGRPLFRVGGRTLGLVGFGKIPRTLVEKAAGFDFELLVYDPYVDAQEIEAHGGEKVTFGELLAESDIISVHTPLTDETESLFDADAFERMQDDAVLVNTSRGAVVDTEALHSALVAGELRRVGLDVMPQEPPDDTPLFDLDDAIVTPHTAWYSEDSIHNLRESIATDVVRAIRGDEPEHVVNGADLSTAS